MNPKFVPFHTATAAKTLGTTFVPKVLPKGESSGAPQDPASTSSTSPTASPCQPQIELQKEGNRIVGVQITCSCGQVIQLECAYPST